MNPPAFQFYADDFIAGTITMTREECGLYILLLCMQWNKGYVLAEDFTRLGKGMAEPSLSHVKAKFTLGEDGNFRNVRMEKERLKQAEFRAARSLAGQKGAAVKHGHSLAMAEPKQTHGKGMTNGVAKASSPSPSPSPSPTGPKIRESNYSVGNKAHGTMLTFSMLDRFARDIVNNEWAWEYDNCKVRAKDLVQASLVARLRTYVGVVSAVRIQEAWQEAVTRTHQAVVDELVNESVPGYVVECFCKELDKLRDTTIAETA